MIWYLQFSHCYFIIVSSGLEINNIKFSLFSGADDIHIKYVADRAVRAAADVAMEGNGLTHNSFLPRDEVEERQPKSSSRGSTGGFLTVITDGASLMLMLAALVIMFLYVQQVNELANKAVADFQIYDAVGYASAHVFMLKKVIPKDTNISLRSEPGDPGR